MHKKASERNKNFKSRASLTQSKNHNLSYSERLSLASKGKKSGGVDLASPTDSAGFITIS
jgi:hypothetical protein